jgi:uncharacterized membrane protein
MAAFIADTAFEADGRHFNRGQRAFFFALGYLGWFIGPLALMLTTVLVLMALWRASIRLGRAARDSTEVGPAKAVRVLLR